MFIVVTVALIVVFSVILFKAADVLAEAIGKLAHNVGVGTFGLTAFLIAVSTSMPEVFVGVISAINGTPALALGNAIGANIANVSLVVGGAALVGGSIGIVGEFIKRDFFTAFLVALLPLLLLIDGSLSRIEGMGLLVVYVVYVMGTLLWEKAYRSKHERHYAHRLIYRMFQRETEKEFLWVGGAAVVLIVAAEVVVRLMTGLMESLQVPIFLGGILLAIGTTLPELSFEIEAIRKKEMGMVFGNLLGTIVANSAMVLGITAVLRPVHLGTFGLQPYVLATLAFMVVFGVFWGFVTSKKKLERWEGALLLAAYVIFLILEFWRLE